MTHPVLLLHTKLRSLCLGKTGPWHHWLWVDRRNAFRSSLKSWGLQLSDDEYKKFWDGLEKDSNDKLGLAEFRQLLHTPTSTTDAAAASGASSASSSPVKVSSDASGNARRVPAATTAVTAKPSALRNATTTSTATAPHGGDSDSDDDVLLHKRVGGSAPSSRPGSAKSTSDDAAPSLQTLCRRMLAVFGTVEEVARAANAAGGGKVCLVFY